MVARFLVNLYFKFIERFQHHEKAYIYYNNVYGIPGFQPEHEC